MCVCAWVCVCEREGKDWKQVFIVIKTGLAMAREF